MRTMVWPEQWHESRLQARDVVNPLGICFVPNPRPQLWGGGGGISPSREPHDLMPLLALLRMLSCLRSPNPQVGSIMAEYPLDPQLAKMVVASPEYRLGLTGLRLIQT